MHLVMSPSYTNEGWCLPEQVEHRCCIDAENDCRISF